MVYVNNRDVGESNNGTSQLTTERGVETSVGIGARVEGSQWRCVQIHSFKCFDNSRARTPTQALNESSDLSAKSAEQKGCTAQAAPPHPRPQHRSCTRPPHKGTPRTRAGCKCTTGSRACTGAKKIEGLNKNGGPDGKRAHLDARKPLPVRRGQTGEQTTKAKLNREYATVHRPQSARRL